MVYLIAGGVLIIAAIYGLICYRRWKKKSSEPGVSIIEFQKWRRRLDGAEQHSYKCRCRMCQQRSRLRRAS